MAEKVTDWAAAAEAAAAAEGQTFLVGVRAHNGSWFAHCGGTEVDGRSPAHATFALIDELKKKADGDRRKSEAEAAFARDRAARYADIHGAKEQGA